MKAHCTFPMYEPLSWHVCFVGAAQFNYHQGFVIGRCVCVMWEVRAGAVSEWHWRSILLLRPRTVILFSKSHAMQVFRTPTHDPRTPDRPEPELVSVSERRKPGSPKAGDQVPTVFIRQALKSRWHRPTLDPDWRGQRPHRAHVIFDFNEDPSLTGIEEPPTVIDYTGRCQTLLAAWEINLKPCVLVILTEIIRLTWRLNPGMAGSCSGSVHTLDIFLLSNSDRPLKACNPTYIVSLSLT